jgi:dCMP deaminase
MKNSEISFLMGVASLAAQQSKAVRLKVGGVVADSLGNLIAYSYNGTPRGFDNTCEYKEYAQHMGLDVSEQYPLIDNKINSVPYRLVTKPFVVHCEANLIAHAARRGISVNGGSVFLTHSPCEHCAALLVQSGIKAVYFIEKFRTYEDMHYLFHTYLELYQWDNQTNTTVPLYMT